MQIYLLTYLPHLTTPRSPHLNHLNYLGEHKRKLLMNAFITSQFNYCSIIWVFCQRKSNNLINRIHERALRIAYNDYTSNFESLLRKDDSVTIPHNIQNNPNINTFKKYTSENCSNLCKCNICIKYIANLGYI